MNTSQCYASFWHKSLLKMAACVFLATGAGTYPLYAADTSNRLATENTQQRIKVTGTIVDKSGEPIIGANIVEKGTTNGTISDLEGRFTLNVNNRNSILKITFIGYKDLEIEVIKIKENASIKLVDDSKALEEIVVVGYGTQKKATLTGSVSQVGGDELKKVSSVNLSNSLAGKTAGIIANTRSGEPGEDNADILIRGKGTLGNTEPLIVVDGIADRDFSRLNPEDIESISVLKDASAAIYGARAANGVILVTTKRGKEGKISINYNGNVGFSQPTRIPEMLNSYQYATYVNEYDLGHGESPTYSAEALQMMQNGQDPIKYPDTNWWEAVAKDWATKTQHSLSVRGGNEKLSFYSSAQYLWQDAIYKKGTQDYNQYQFTTNIDAEISKAIHFSFDILGRQEVRNRGIYSTEDLFGYFLTTSPMAAPYYPNGLPRVGFDGVTNNAAIKVTDLPGTNKTTYNTLNLKPKIRFNLDFVTKGLYVEGYAALDYHFNNGKSLKHPYDVYQYDYATKEYINRRDATGTISVNSWASNDNTITLNGRIGYSQTFKQDHRVEAFIAYEQSKYNYNTVSAYRTNYLSTAIPEIFAGSDVAADKDNGGYSLATARQNYFGRINYGYKDKYLAEVTLRYDGSMNFAPGKRWGLFPAFSAGWVISEESFFENTKRIINFLKVKGSWGMMGNDAVTAFQYVSQYKFNTDISSCFGESVVKGLYESRTANPLITWEKAKTFNIGFNSQFLDGKFSLDFDYFKSKRNDILITRNASVPVYSGLSLPAENLGKVNNQGIEIVAGYHDQKGAFKWGATGNFTYAKNKVVYMDEAASTPEWQRTTGHTIDGLVLYKALGIYQTQEEINKTPHIAGAKPGDLMYEDTNGDKKITWDDAIRIDQSATPKIVYGLTLNGSWKGLDLNVFFQGQADAKQLIQPTMNMATDFFEGRWIETNAAEVNANAKWPRAFIKQTYGDQWNGVSSTWWLRDASFLRLKSIELGYSIPKSMIQTIGIQNARIYINANNLFTIDNMKICDPEAGMFRNNDGYVVESGGVKGYPLQRMITVGASITF